MLITDGPREMPDTQRQRRFYIRISLSSLSGKPMRSAGNHKGKGKQLGGFITVAQELRIGSIYAFFLSMSRGLLQRMTYTLSMAINMGTCREACIALGLLEDDGEWCQCLEEACQTQVGKSVCQLFAIIIAYNHPTYPEVLWEDFKHRMCDDLLHWHRYPFNANSTDDEVLDYGLYLIKQHLARENIDLYGPSYAPRMPQVQGDWMWGSTGIMATSPFKDNLNSTMLPYRGLSRQLGRVSMLANGQHLMLLCRHTKILISSSNYSSSMAQVGQVRPLCTMLLPPRHA